MKHTVQIKSPGPQGLPPHEKGRRPQVLTIAGSDSGGGAGIQGDIKAIEANGAYALSVITSVTAQNTCKTIAAFDLPLSIIKAQLQAVFEDFEISAIKTGMLASKAIVKGLAEFLAKQSPKHLVVDPVMVSKSGYALLKPDAIASLVADIIPIATLLTPNIVEAETLSKISIKTIEEAEQAAKTISQLGCPAVLIKGGHLAEAPGCDILFDQGTITRFEGQFIETPHTHGTGCAYSAAIAAQLAHGKALVPAIKAAKHYLSAAIGHPLHIGHGQGPINHFYFLSESGASNKGDRKQR